MHHHDEISGPFLVKMHSLQLNRFEHWNMDPGIPIWAILTPSNQLHKITLWDLWNCPIYSYIPLNILKNGCPDAVRDYCGSRLSSRLERVWISKMHRNWQFIIYYWVFLIESSAPGVLGWCFTMMVFCSVCRSTTVNPQFGLSLFGVLSRSNFLFSPFFPFSFLKTLKFITGNHETFIKHKLGL